MNSQSDCFACSLSLGVALIVACCLLHSVWNHPDLLFYSHQLLDKRNRKAEEQRFLAHDGSDEESMSDGDGDFSDDDKAPIHASALPERDAACDFCHSGDTNIDNLLVMCKLCRTVLHQRCTSPRIRRRDLAHGWTCHHCRMGMPSPYVKRKMQASWPMPIVYYSISLFGSAAGAS